MLVFINYKFQIILRKLNFFFSDGFLNLGEFDCICRALFRSDRGKIYGLEPDKLQEVFDIFDVNKVSFIIYFYFRIAYLV